VAIAQNIDVEVSRPARIIDCTAKIISPGFVDTHHHVWQTCLKGTHADETLLDYFPSG
jgi:cytosine/adenosine deaminase-related metal-dependent hydrolase